MSGGFSRRHSFACLRHLTRDMMLHLIGREPIGVVVVVVVRLTICVDIASVVRVVVVEGTRVLQNLTQIFNYLPLRKRLGVLYLSSKISLSRLILSYKLSN